MRLLSRTRRVDEIPLETSSRLLASFLDAPRPQLWRYLPIQKLSLHGSSKYVMYVTSSRTFNEPEETSFLARSKSIRCCLFPFFFIIRLLSSIAFSCARQFADRSSWFALLVAEWIFLAFLPYFFPFSCPPYGTSFRGVGNWSTSLFVNFSISLRA